MVVQKVLWCCGELNLPYERIDAGMQFGVNDTDAYRAMNPNGLVPTIDDGGTRIRLPVGTEGSRALVEAVRRFDGAGLHVDELAMHRPTLDDVFLTLTGHGAERDQTDAAPAASGRRGRRGR